MADRCVSVVLPMRVGRPYDYRIPDYVGDIPIGSFVRVPLGSRALTGVVWGPGQGDFDDNRLRDIQHVHEAPPLQTAHRKFLEWVARYTMASLGGVVKMAMPVPEALWSLKPRVGYELGDGVPRRLTAARQRVIDHVSRQAEPQTATEISTAVGVSMGVVRGLAEVGALSPHTIQRDTFAWPSRTLLAQRMRPTLSDPQSAAAHHLRAAVSSQFFTAVLLDGVTGSGKTEVYFEAIESALMMDRQVLVLLPEIALTSQWLSRFEQRFGFNPAVWHSNIGPGVRRRLWCAAASGRVPVIVGARSALFLPMPNLGLIVVDEEHDASFKQEEGVIYHGRDMAVVRGQHEAVPVVMASATPALESVVNVATGRYQRLVLPDRYGMAELPNIHMINMLTNGPEPGKWLAPSLVRAVDTALERGDQAMLFLNRRGYAPLTLCRTCGYRFSCPNCSAWLVIHKSRRRLVCHHCEFNIREPRDCPQCGSSDSLAACGPGVERVAEEAQTCFPDARIAILTSDTAQKPEQTATIITALERREIDILIGTQMVAKGYHFPNLTTIGVIDADLGLSGGDLRAGERTYQLLHQVAGRAGRAEHRGHVHLQSYQPQHPVMTALTAGARDQFYAAEQSARQSAHMPPYARLVGIVVSGKDLERVQTSARALAATAPRMDGVVTYGPAPAPLAFLRGRHRWRLLMQTKKKIKVQGVMADWLARQKKLAGSQSKVRITVDVDPYSFL